MFRKDVWSCKVSDLMEHSDRHPLTQPLYSTAVSCQGRASGILNIHSHGGYHVMVYLV